MSGCGKICSALCCSTGQTNDPHHRMSIPSLPTHDHKAQKANDHHVSKPHGNKQEGHPSSELETNDRFSDYIYRAKKKIRHSMTNLGGSSNSKAYSVHDTKNEEATKDTFSDYIKRVKSKIKKTPSSNGSRKGLKGKTG
ncbi:unnamed protein product [Prunus armeniaca]|uniref:Uncharacterized protein n=1 Tax=Prunus armeniaca TaxID=36596 RepID=A0A6J5V9E9_PRUAR|nr:unnamed protein product [Prunus armeniaca]CAB4315881.1 unnamed protein product [Prunus armeniaca]